MNYEEILSALGGCGPYQLVLLFALAMTCLLGGIDLEMNIFMHYTPTFYCKDSSFLALVNSTEFRKVDECLAVRSAVEPNTSILEPKEIKCTAWHYDDSVLRSTLVTEYDLVCDNEYLLAIIESLYLAGISVGMILGVLGDRYGRRRMILACALWEGIINLATPLAHNIYLLVALRFARGFSQSIYYQGLALISEIVPMKYRAVYGSNYWIFWGLGYIGIPGIAYATKDWRLMKWYSSIPQLVYLSFIFLVPESPRWLSTMGRKREAKKMLRKIARWNGRGDLAILQEALTYEENEMDLINEEKNLSHNPDHMIDAFRLPNMRLKTLTFWMILASVAIGYFGLSIDEKFASEDIFLNVFYMGLIEIPTGPAGWLLCDKVGRRTPLAITLFTSGIAILCAPFLRYFNIHWLSTIVAVLGKFLLSVSYQVADVYVVEIFPTTLRNMGVFTACTWAQITTIVAPFINRLSQRVFFGSAMIFSVMILLSGLLTCLFLPETKDCPLAQTVAEAEAFRRGNEKEWSQNMLKKNDQILEITENLQSLADKSCLEESVPEGKEEDSLPLNFLQKSVPEVSI